MSRSGYSDDCDDYGYPLGFYRKAVDNAMRGKRGQKFLRDLLTALDAMPQKRLIKNELVAKTGEVCAIGALGNARSVDMSDIDPGNADRVAATFGIAASLAREVVYENDEHGRSTYVKKICQQCHGWGEIAGRFRPVRCHACHGQGRLSFLHHRETPEERFTRMRAWVESQIVEPAHD